MLYFTTRNIQISCTEFLEISLHARNHILGLQNIMTYTDIEIFFKLIRKKKKISTALERKMKYNTFLLYFKFY